MQDVCTLQGLSMLFSLLGKTAKLFLTNPLQCSYNPLESKHLYLTAFCMD